MELSKKTTILFTPEQHKRLTDLARRSGTSIGELVRAACEKQYGLVTPEKRQWAVAELGSLYLPVADTKTMKRQSVPEPEELLP